MRTHSDHSLFLDSDHVCIICGCTSLVSRSQDSSRLNHKHLTTLTLPRRIRLCRILILASWRSLLATATRSSDMDFMCYKGKENSIEKNQGEEDKFNDIEYNTFWCFCCSCSLISLSCCHTDTPIINLIPTFKKESINTIRNSLYLVG